MKTAMSCNRLLNIYLSLFVYIGLEKPQWGVPNYVYIDTHIMALLLRITKGNANPLSLYRKDWRLALINWESIVAR